MAIYANINDLHKIFADIDSYDLKIDLSEFDFIVHAGTTYRLDNSGNISSLFRDGKDLGEATGSITDITGSDVWFYTGSSDTLYIQLDNHPASGSRFEYSPQSSIDRQTLALQDASEQLESLLDYKFPRPIPKSTRSNSSREYDAYIIKATAIIAAINLIAASDPNDPIIERFETQLYNEAGTGIIDQINTGKIRLSFEITDSDRAGEIEEGSLSTTTTGYPANMIGTTTVAYDFLTLTITAGGTLTANTENTTIKYKSQNLEGDELVAATLIDGFHQDIGRGIRIRWATGIYNVNDTWTIQLRGEKSLPSNMSVISLSRI